MLIYGAFLISPHLGIVLLFVLLFVIIRYTSVVQGYFTPIHKVLAKTKSKVDGHTIEAVLEGARLHSATQGGFSAIITDLARLSIYDRTERKRICRALVGDDAVFLGIFDKVFWFYIHSKFYTRKDGLVGRSALTGQIVDRLPKRKFALEEQDRDQPQIVELRDNEDRVSRYDLRRRQFVSGGE